MRASGELILSLKDGRLLRVGTDGSAGPLEVTPTSMFDSPSDIKILMTPGGEEILIVPEQDARGEGHWKQRLRVIRL